MDMTEQISPSQILAPQLPPKEGSLNGLDIGEGAPKAKTSLRMLYEAKANLICRQLGGLLGVQRALGLSQRKLAQLLMVDPSTWNRWSKNEEQIPPHIWRSLEWYLALQDKVPGLTPAHFTGVSLEQLDERFDVLANELRQGQLAEEQSQSRQTHQKLSELEGQIKHMVHAFEVQNKQINIHLLSLHKKNKNLWYFMAGAIGAFAVFGLFF